MLFNTYPFLAFLALAAVGYRAVYGLGANVRIAWLFLASLAFYAVNDLPHLPLLAAAIVFNHFMGVRIIALAGRPSRRAWLTFAVGANVAVLVLYKYLAVIAGSAGLVAFGTVLSHGPALPLGISFFTFTQIAFLIDCSRGEVTSPKLLDFSVFVSWFPHLVAGPLLPHRRILPQLRGPEARKPDADDYAVGLTLFVIGFFKKAVLADSLNDSATSMFRVLGNGQLHGFAPAWLVSAAALLDLYFDFSGYSDMAMGVSRMFGIHLPVNFYSPFRAQNPTDFWRRWHRTLSWFIRAYIYSPFAGRRQGLGQYLRLMGIMAVVGLWHGSTPNFLLWGLYQGALLCLYNFWRLSLGHRPNRHPSLAAKALAQVATFLAMIASAGLFYYRDFGQCLRFYRSVFGLAGLGSPWSMGAQGLAFLALALAVVWLAPNAVELVRGRLPAWVAQQLPRDAGFWRPTWRPRLGWALALGALAAIALAAIPRSTSFVYNVF